MHQIRELNNSAQKYSFDENLLKEHLSNCPNLYHSIRETSMRKEFVKDEIEYHTSETHIIFDDGKTYLSYPDEKENRFIGYYFGDIDDIPLNNSIASQFPRALELASNCLTPNTKSNSPSMILHQAASLTLALIMDAQVIFEHSGEYTPDLYITREGMSGIYLDVCGESMLNKILSIRVRPIIVINKYLLLKEMNNSKYSYLFSWSQLNDSSDYNYIYDRYCQYAKLNNKEELATLSQIKFFSTGRDVHGRDLNDHNDAARRVLRNKLVQMIDNTETKKQSFKKLQSQRQVFSKRIAEIRRKLKVEISDNKYYFFPQHDDEFETKNYNEFDSNLAFLNDIVYLEYEINRNKDPSSDQLFTYVSTIQVPVSYYSEMLDLNYMKQENSEILTSDAIKIINYYKNTDAANLALTLLRRLNNSVRTYPNYNENFEPNYKPFRLKPLRGCMPTKLETHCMWTSSTFLSNVSQTSFYRIDPDHEIVIKRQHCDALIEQLSICRDYHELRFKARISTAILNVKRPDKPFIVKHHSLPHLHAVCLIKGLILERDKGVCLVSYMHKGKLIRFEKWRLPDVENFTVNHHRLISLMCGFMQTGSKKTHKVVLALRIYSRILNENSWGLSEVLKPYRYLSIGALTESPMLLEQLDKFEKAIFSSNAKLSIHMILAALKLTEGRTPLFHLRFSSIGWDCFLLNLCPNKTYGHHRHMNKICQELFSEIDLYKTHFNLAKDLYEEFDKLLDSKDSLDTLYKNYFDKVDRLSELTDERFTGSPLTNVLNYSSIKRISYKSVQNMLPHSSELMTAKANYLTYEGRSGLAMEAIDEVRKTFGTTSTSLLGLKLLSKEGALDLMMWLFDKMQVGGDREISVLTGQFRILQVIVERFFEGVSKSLNNEFLHRKDKLKQLAERVEKSLKAVTRKLMAIDQTRWGPNWNTICFAYNSLIIMSNTTEAYLPSLILMLAEFKAFEVPITNPSKYASIDVVLSLPCAIARSHMGQGIFHNSSSVSHALSTTSYLELFEDILYCNQLPLQDVKLIKSTSMITSDDAMLTIYLDELPTNCRDLEDQYNEVKSQFPQKSEALLVNLKNIFKYFGIKTSNYKNWISRKSIEFNSFFLSQDGIGSNDIKFLYSMIDPSTTGDFLQDYANLTNSYYSSANSGVSAYSLSTVTDCNYLRFCRQWKLRADVVGFPSYNTMLRGLPAVITDIDEVDRTITPSALRYKLRKKFEEPAANTYDEIMIKIVKDAISRSREISSYRSCLTYAKKDHISNFSNYFTNLGLIGESFGSFVYHQNENFMHYEQILNDTEHPYLCSFQSRETDESLFVSKVIRKSFFDNLQLWTLVLAYSEDVVAINSNSSDDEILCHMMRRHKNITLESDPFDLKDMKLIPRIDAANKIIQENSLKNSGSVILEHNPSREKKSYTTVMIEPPFVLTSIKVSLFTFSSGIEFNERYNTKLADSIYTFDQKRLRTERLVGRVACRHQKFVQIEIRQPTLDEVRIIVEDPLFLETERQFLEEKEIFINVALEELCLPDNISEDHATTLSDIFSMEGNSELIANAMGELDEVFEDLVSSDEEEDYAYEDKYDSSSGEDIDDIFTQTNKKHRFISLQIHQDYSVYMGHHSRKICSSYAIGRLIQEGAIVCKDEVTPYCVASDTEMQCTDKELGIKIQKYALSSSQMMRGYHGEAKTGWIRIIKDICEKGAMEVPKIRPAPILSSIPAVFISIRPAGLIVEPLQFIVEVGKLNL